MSMRLLSWTTTTALVLLVAVLGLGAAACGSDDDDASGDSAASGSASVSSEAQDAIDAAYTGSFVLPPSDAPAPEAGKNIWFIPISSETYDYRRKGSLYDAAERLGWDITQVDGKFSPDAIVSGIRQAIADKADGIILYIVDCANVRAALQEADRAGIPVVAAQGYDCDELGGNGPSLFDAVVAYADPEHADRPMSFKEFIVDGWAEAQALAVVNGTGGEAKLIDVYESDLLVTVEQDKGVRSALERHCPACEIVETVEFTGGEIGAPLQQKIEQALTRHPEANAIISPYDAVTKITAAAIRGAGRAGDIYSVGAEGEAGIMDAIRNGGQGVDAGVALAPDWEQHAMLDAMNRLFAGEDPGEGFPTGNGTQIIDKARNLPPEPGSRYEPPVDFREAYYEAWGVN